jgi:hypothetical protein
MKVEEVEQVVFTLLKVKSDQLIVFSIPEVHPDYFLCSNPRDMTDI